jgi:hypothetical protein
MARVDPNSTLGGVRGSVAGMVISSGLSGWNARTAVTPLRSRSQLQAEQRLLLGIVAAKWKTLSAATRADWAAAAALPAWKRLDWFGNAYSMGGYGLFVSLQMPLATRGLLLYSDPPDAVFPDPVAITAATMYRAAASVDAHYTVDPAPNTSAANYRLWLSVAALGSSAPLANRRILDVIEATSGATSRLFWSRAAARFGLPLIGQAWTLFFSTFDNYGRPSQVSSFVVPCQEPPP